MNKGYELRGTPEKGKGIFALKAFKQGDIVMVGVIEKELAKSNAHSSQIGENRHVLHGGLISKVNHSCDPNCGIKVNETGAHDFVARRVIKFDEEITFDYAMRNYSVDYFPKKCVCNSKNCRGAVTGWKSLSKKRKEEYKGYVAPYLLELDDLKSNLKTLTPILTK